MGARVLLTVEHTFSYGVQDPNLGNGATNNGLSPSTSINVVKTILQTGSPFNLI